jgi:hypothetical protein
MKSILADVLSLSIVAGCCFVIGMVFTGKVFMESSIQAGHAEYYLDAEHARQWRWLPVGDGVTTATAERETGG